MSCPDEMSFLIFDIIDLLFNNLKILNPINDLPYYFLKHSSCLKDLVLKLVFYGGIINEKFKLSLLEKNIFTNEDIININNLANNKYKAKEKKINIKKNEKHIIIN